MIGKQFLPFLTTENIEAPKRGKAKSVLVTGPDGFVGSQLCNDLLSQGNFVKGAMWSNVHYAREKETAAQRFVPVVVGDIGPDTDWATALTEVEVVVHLAARVHVMRKDSTDSLAAFRRVNVEGTRRLAEAAARTGVKRFIYLSSIKVNGEETTKRPFTESDSPKPDDAYATSKWEAEKVLREIERRMGIEVVILRPPLVYGPGVKANFLRLIQLIESGIPLPLGGIANKRSLLSLTNLTNLICRCVDHPAAPGETFLVSDAEDVSTPELVRRIARSLGKPARLLPVPEWIMNLGGTVLGRSDQVKRICNSLLIDSSKIRRILSWTPLCSMSEELTKIARWRAECRKIPTC